MDLHLRLGCQCCVRSILPRWKEPVIRRRLRRTSLSGSHQDASCLWRKPTPSSRRKRPFRLTEQSQAGEKLWIKWGTSRKRLRPVRTKVSSLPSRNELAACEATPASYSPGQARLVLRWGGRGFHFNWFFAFRDTNRQDANSTARLGSNTNHPALDLLPDEFLDIGQVGGRFEVTPAGFVCSVTHQFVLSTGRWNDIVPRSSLSIPQERIPR